MKEYEKPKADITLQCEDVLTASDGTQVTWDQNWQDEWSWWNKE